MAALVKQYKDRVIVHLPSSCTVKHLLWTVAEHLLTGTVRRAPNTA